MSDFIVPPRGHRTLTYDIKCHELAEHFMSPANVIGCHELAYHIQKSIEEWMMENRHDDV